MPRPRNVCAAPDARRRASSTANPNATIRLTGRASGPRCSAPVAYGFASPRHLAGSRRVHTFVATWITMMSSPKLTSSELNSTMSSRS